MCQLKCWRTCSRIFRGRRHRQQQAADAQALAAAPTSARWASGRRYSPYYITAPCCMHHGWRQRQQTALQRSDWHLALPLCLPLRLQLASRSASSVSPQGSRVSPFGRNEAAKLAGRTSESLAVHHRRKPSSESALSLVSARGHVRLVYRAGVVCAGATSGCAMLS